MCVFVYTGNASTQESENQREKIHVYFQYMRYKLIESSFCFNVSIVSNNNKKNIKEYRRDQTI